MKNITIENKRLRMEILLQDGVFIRKCSNLSSGQASEEAAAKEGTDKELFYFTDRDNIIHSGEFVFDSPSLCRDKTEELCTFSALHPSLGLRLRIHFINNLADTISILFQMADDTEDCYRGSLSLHSPFLAGLNLGDIPGQKYYFPADPASRPDGSSILALHPCIHLPLVITDKNDQAGFSVSFPTLSSLELAVQNRNVELWKLASIEDLKNHSLTLRLSHTITDILEISVCGLADGWREAFSRVRSTFRKNLDLREYQKDELHWFRDACLHHFTFLYSKEAYDYEAQKPHTDKLIKDGEEFGGYDTLTFWHQYPQLGVDERSQWDFFRDFPGGLAGLAEAVAQAHRHGLKVLLPYKPWDISGSQSMEDAGEQISGLIRDTDADGFFLDTMDQAPEKFRQAADSVKPGIVFCSEQHPATLDSLSILTASWDQFWDSPCMPGIDLLRFILPEHSAPLISRWAIGPEKDGFINRAIFSGSGLVIWQDVFGAWLPFSPEQKERIKQYKVIWKEYHSYLYGPAPIPLYPAVPDRLYCNFFTDEAETGAVYTFYNDSTEEITGLLAVNRNEKFKKGRCILGNSQLDFEDNKITGSVLPGEAVMYFVE